MDLEKSFAVFTEAYEQISKIDDQTTFCSVIGVIIDQWAADHDMSVEESKEMVKSLVDAHGFVNDNLGMMHTSSENGGI